MAGHGRRIPQDSGRDRGLLSLTDHLPNNTWRRVFTSLRPLVTHGRHRTLRNTYARRLQQRQSDHLLRVHQPDPDPREARDSTSPEWQPLLPSPGPLREAPGEPQTPPVVIDIEGATSQPANTTDQNTEDQPTPTRPHALAPPRPHALAPPRPNALATPSNGGVAGQEANPEDDRGLADVDHEATSEEEPAEPSRSASESINELLNQFPEIRHVLVLAGQYCIFLLILLTKAVFDHCTGLLMVLGLAVAFLWSNSILKKAVARQGRRPVKPLLALIVNLPAGILLVYYYGTNNLFYSVLLIPPDFEGLGVLDLIWLVVVVDYILKLFTVLLKTLLTLLPLHHRNRGKYFLVVEMASQLYRSLAPMQPWLAYLLDGYTGTLKVFGVLLSAAYMVCKGPDIVAKMKAFQAAVVKYINSVNYGSAPSKGQLDNAGGICPICHDEFTQPTMLACKHIFCEQCVNYWFDRERTCPMCRKQVAEDPLWRDGSTSHFVQLY